MKTVLLGGTGTLGTALTERLLAEGQRVVSFSRGELAQKQYQKKFPDVETVIGDVRDKDAVLRVMANADSVFLLAAIKHVDLAEKNPREAIKTNIHGAMNVVDAADFHQTPFVVYSNTDKAVLPITTYGYTKALAQNFLLSENVLGSWTRYSVFNWGNIIASRGSVIQTFVEMLSRREPIKITHPEMSRFWLEVDEAADFMLAHYKTAPLDRALIPTVKAAKLTRVIASLARAMDAKAYELEVTGLRGTEKLYEVLESTHKSCIRSDTCEQFSDQELDDLFSPVVRTLTA